MSKWTRERIIRDILRRESAGLPLGLGGQEAVGPAMYNAASRIFGSWRNALIAAGIPAGKSRCHPRWTPEKVLSAIRSLARRRRPISQAALNQTHFRLVNGARRCFGSWRKAVLAAGVDPATFRRVVPWTRERIMEAILKRALNNEPLERRVIEPRSMPEAATRIFGCWGAALAAAGVDPALYLRQRPDAKAQGAGPRRTDHRDSGAITVSAGLHSVPTANPNQRRSRELVLQELLARLAGGLAMDATTVLLENKPLLRAAESRFGSWRNALQAAGLDPQKYRKRPQRGRAGPNGPNGPMPECSQVSRA